MTTGSVLSRLTRLLVKNSGLPVIAAGGIMDGAGIAAALRLGAAAAQMGTAFVGCPEFRRRPGLSRRAGRRGRQPYHDDARHLRPPGPLPGQPLYQAGGKRAGRRHSRLPITYDLGKALHAAAKAKGEFGFGAQWAGQGAPLSRPMPAAELVRVLVAEMHAA